MKKLISHIFVACSLIVLSFPSYGKERDIEPRLFALVNEIAEAARHGDFEFIAKQMHSDSLTHFRRVVMARIEQIERTFSRKDLEAVMEISLDEASRWNDQRFFEEMCRSAWNITPEIIGDFKSPQITLLGVVSEDAWFHYVLYRFAHEVGSEVDKIEVKRARVMTFREEKGTFSLWTFMFSDGAPRTWYKELAGRTARGQG